MSQTTKPRSSAFSRFCHAATFPLALAFAGVTVAPGLATASMVATDQVLEEIQASSPLTAQTEDRARVQAFLAREDVRAELAALGVDPQEATARLEGLSDAEVAAIAGHLSEDPAGEGVGAVVAVGVILFIVLIFTDITGLTNIFSFTR